MIEASNEKKPAAKELPIDLPVHKETNNNDCKTDKDNSLKIGGKEACASINPDQSTITALPAQDVDDGNKNTNTQADRPKRNRRKRPAAEI